MASVNIKTGVDKLVELISTKKKISVDAAAKELGVGKNVVQEWADFLEEEGAVTIDVSLSKTWLVERKIAPEDVIQSAGEVSSQKEAFSRRIDVAMTSLQQETSRFEDVRKEFSNIQGHIKSEIETVKNQLTELERFDSLRKNLDKDIDKQKKNYEDIVKDANEKLRIESEKYTDLKSLIDKEKKSLDQYGQKMEELKRLRNDYERTVSTLKDSLKKIDDVVSEYRKRFEDSQKVVSNYQNALDRLNEELSEKKSSTLSKKLEGMKDGEQKLFKKQMELESNMKKAISSVQSYAGISDKVHSSLDGYFSKNISTEKLIAEIENDKTDLTKYLEELKSKVLKFTLMTSNESIKGQMKDIEAKLKEFERKKLSIRYKIEKLVSMIKGK